MIAPALLGPPLCWALTFGVCRSHPGELVRDLVPENGLEEEMPPNI